MAALRGIKRGLRRLDPHLAAMLAMFARLCAGEAIISREQTCTAPVGAGRVLAGARHRPGPVRPVNGEDRIN